MLDALTHYGITARAVQQGLVSVHAHQLRDYAHDAYKTIDDRPYGGGPGMVMMPGPLTEAVQAIRSAQQQSGLAPGPVVLLSPSGTPIDQALVDRVATGHCWTLVCGRYEGWISGLSISRSMNSGAWETLSSRVGRLPPWP